MTSAWLTIIGLGEDGLEGLADKTRQIIDNAEIIIASKRLLKMLPDSKAEKHCWPTPFDPMIAKLKSWKGRRIIMLATGDPMWYGAGSTLARYLGPKELHIIPSPSAFSLVAARIGWPLAETELLSLHGRPASLIIPYLQPDTRLIALTSGHDTIIKVAEILNQTGYGDSTIYVFENMGGKFEQYHSFSPQAIPPIQFSAFNTMAIRCKLSASGQILPRTPGLPDSAFRHDGQLTKQAVRATTIAALAPVPGQLLWDIGAGCGSIAIEWSRCHRLNRAIAFEASKPRIDYIRSNMDLLGTPFIEIIEGKAPQSLAGQPAPDAIFIGGGITEPEMISTCFKALRTHGRLIANSVTNEGEAALLKAAGQFGGELTRIAISNTVKIGGKTAFRPALPITQWRLVKA